MSRLPGEKSLYFFLVIALCKFGHRKLDISKTVTARSFKLGIIKSIKASSLRFGQLKEDGE